MLDEKYIKIINKIINKYGKEAQVLQTVEELSELIEELCESNEKLQNPQITKAIKTMAKLIKSLNKNINRGKDNIKEITLEIADVLIMIMQLVEIYNIDGDKILGAMEYKLLRQKERIENEI